MIATIVGWYGTETSGDRAILDGILSVLNEFDENAQIKLGSLFPFYSKRTFWEEKDVFGINVPKMKLEIFDIKEKSQMTLAVESSDILILGGGPLMDLEELYLIDRAFSIAYKNRIPALVMGCGMGPLNNAKYIKLVEKIFEKSTRISFRDIISGRTAEKLWPNKFSYECLGDPAIISVEKYLEMGKITEKGDYLAVNFRDYPGEQYGSNSSVNMEDIAEMLNVLSESYGKILLVPMHTFYVGNDDRKYLTKLKMCCENSKIEVIHKPMNLHELYEIYQNAKGCIGMRYHSIVMQTILNGNNLIFDYTDPNTGKIAGFLNMEDAEKFYCERKVCLKKDADKNLKQMSTMLYSGQKFEWHLSDMKKKYIRFLSFV